MISETISLSEEMLAARDAERSRVLSLPPDEREKELVAWASRLQFGNGEGKHSLDEAWEKVYSYGILVLQKSLRGLEGGRAQQLQLIQQQCDSGSGGGGGGSNGSSSSGNGVGGKVMVMKPFATRGYFALCTITYQMGVTQGTEDCSPILYEKVHDSIHNWLVGTIVPALNEKQGNSLLREFYCIWEEHKQMTECLRRIFVHLDKGHVENNPFGNNGSKGVATLTSMSLNLYYELVFSNTSSQVCKCMLEVINDERRHEQVDEAQLKECVSIFEIMGMAHALKDLQSIKQAMHRPMILDIYTSEFERPFLIATRAYYSSMSQQWIQSSDISSYLRLADEAIREEDDRVTRYLNSTTKDKLIKTCLEEIVVVHRVRLNEAIKDVLKSIYSYDEGGSTGCNGGGRSASNVFSVPDDKRDNLKRMFTLFHRTHILEPTNPNFDLINHMAAAFNEYVLEMGTNIVNARKEEIRKMTEELKAYSGGGASGGEGKGENGSSKKSLPKAPSASDPEFITSILRLFKNMQEITRTIFQDNPAFVSSLKKALEKTVNKDLDVAFVKITQSQMLATHIDKVLRLSKGQETCLTEISECLHVFQLIDDKDVFEAFYRNLLSKRLLNRLLGSDFAAYEIEKTALSLIKIICGGSFTAKIEGMMKDFAAIYNNETRTAFRNHYNEWRLTQPSASQKIDLEVDVFTFGMWPAQTICEAKLPQELQARVDMYEKWYQREHSGKRLDWVFSRGEIAIGATFGARKYTLNMATLQGIIVLLFDAEELSRRGRTSGELSFEDILSLSGIKNAETLRIVLDSLYKVDSKQRFLLRSPSGEDAYQVNQKYSSALVKVKAASFSLERQSKITQDVSEDRSLLVEAAIVRTMKARRTMKHSDLLTEVLRQLDRFKPDIKMVKDRIEHLIQRDYLERDEADAAIFNYLA